MCVRVPGTGRCAWWTQDLYWFGHNVPTTRLASRGIRVEQVAEVGLGRDGVCSEGESCVEHGKVCARGLVCTPVVLHVQLGVDKRRAITVVARVITNGESLIRLRLVAHVHLQPCVR